jgi:protein-disulfide isomerase
MKRIIIAASILAIALVGCQKEGESGDKLDQIAKRLDDMDKKLDTIASTRGAAAAAPQRPQRPRPDPTKVYSVPVGNSPIEGSATAKVTLVKAYEFACPYCERVRPTLAALKEKYGDDLRIVHKQLLIHPQVATTPALAVCAAHKQGKFLEMAELVWEKGYKANRNLGEENMDKLAAEAGLDIQRYKADMKGKECQAQLQQDRNDVTKVGASGTPAFFINGRFLSGARPQNFFEQLIDEELKKANEAIAKGASAETYYNDYVVKKGAKSL